MPVIGRAALPQEFFEVTSAMLLKAPEPQYFYAQMWKAALGAALGPVSLPNGIGASGAPYASLESNQLMIENAQLPGEIISVVPELGKAPGHTVRINRPVFTNSTYTQLSRSVPNGTAISTTPLDLSSQQTSITLERLAGPYGSSSVQPYGIDAFDASLPLHSIASIVGMQLQRDFDRFIDSWVTAQFDLASSTVRPTGCTADNDSTAAGAFMLDAETLLRADKTLDEANIPTFSNGRRICVLHPNQIMQLGLDSEFRRESSREPVSNPYLSKGYYKTFGNIDIYKSSTLTTASNSSSVTIYRGHMFGPGMVGAGVGKLPHTAFSSSDNYGEQALVVWLMYAGMAVLNNTFGCIISSS